MELHDILKERILVLDGAMGTMVQRCGLGEEDFTALLNEHKEMNAGLTEPGSATASGDAPDELDAVIRLHVRKVFDKYGQNMSKTAQALKVARNTVRKYL